MESDVTVLCGRIKALCEACTQTVPGLNGAAELHTELALQIQRSWSAFYAVCVHVTSVIVLSCNCNTASCVCTLSVRLSVCMSV